MNFWEDSVFVTSVLAWFTTQIIKVILTLITKKRLDFRRLVGSGGMPSSHAAFVTSLSAAVGMERGVGSIEFSILRFLRLWLCMMRQACAAPQGSRQKY